MKKLMFALVAGVAATVATAAPITQSGFETTEGFTVGSNPTNNATARFSYVSSSSSEDGSTVKEYTAEGMEKKSVSYDNGEFAGVGDNYLELNTDGGTLYRSINDIPLNASYGEATNVTSSLYIDTLVQFTVCDSAPEIDNGAKLAIWLQASDDESVTNLMVKAKQWTVYDDGALKFTEGTSTNRVYTLANLNNTPYAAGQWYRLTVEDLGNVFTASGRGATGFKILIDGQAVGAVSGSAFVTTGDADATSVLTGKVGDVAGLTDGSVFMSMADDTIINNDYSSTLCAVGFSGTGAVDNIMFTEDNPFFEAPTAIDFTIALSNVGSVGYSFTTNGYNETGSFTATGGTLEDLPPGTAVTLTPTAKTDELGWNIYGTPVVENAVNAAIDTTEGIVVTLAPTFTQGMGDTASVQVNASETPLAKDNAAFSGAQWSTPAGKLTDEQFADLVAWARANGYSTSRVANYPYALERMATGYNIEMSVFVATNAFVVSYDSTIPGTASTDAETGEPDGAGVMYTVDAGLPFTLSNFTYVAPSANKMYKLDGDNASENWKPDPESQVSGLTIAVDQATSNSVTFTTSATAATAEVGLGVVEVDVPKIYYTITFVDGSTSTPVQKEAGSTIVAGDIPAFVGQTGYTAAWDNDPLGDEVTGNATYTAVYTINTYTITFVDGASSTPVQKEYGSTIAAGDVPAFIGQTGYTAAWDDDPVGDEVTGNATYTAVYTINTYTVTVAAGDNMTVAVTTNSVAAGAAGVYVVNYNDSASVVYTANSGYNIGGQSSYTTNFASIVENVSVAAPTATASSTPLNPGESDGKEYNSQAAAEAAAAGVTPTAASEVSTELGEVATATYLKNFETKVVENGNGTYSVKVELTAAAETALEANATTQAETVATKLDDMAAAETGEKTSVNLTGATPGFYYSISYGTAVGALNTEGARVMAPASGSLQLQTPAKASGATSGFYRVNVNVKAAD